MFTGIVEETGKVERIEPGDKSIQLTVRAKVCGKGIGVSDSLAVNGCCLTVVGAVKKGAHKLLKFDLLRESWNKTNLQYVEEGSLVNLERSLAANGSLGGHFVLGHVDGIGKIVKWERSGDDWVLDVTAPKEIKKYLIYKGSIAVDGISLTVAEVKQKYFRIWIIPHTYEITALKERKVGDAVNLEADILGKYVEQFLSLKKIK
ncbi:MAG: riboflavin synthase [Verrucomicrobia bacterium]|nr:riboflavin synthase [Verrucomicrobiota bacterium]